MLTTLGWFVHLFAVYMKVAVQKQKVYNTSDLTHDYECLIKVLVEIITVCLLVACTPSETVVCGISLT